MKKDDSTTSDANVDEQAKVHFDTSEIDSDPCETAGPIAGDDQPSGQGKGKDQLEGVPGAPSGSMPDDEVVDPNVGLSFQAPVPVVGEKLVPLNRITDWEFHPANGSSTRGENAAGLLASALDPANIAPITLLPSKDGLYPIQDGRLRWHALKEVHGADSDIEVRCVMFAGSEAEAVQAACDDALGGTPRSQIQIARAVLNVQRIAGISQKAISDRYSVLKKDQVNRLTIAAKTVEEYPTVFALLEEPDRVSIDLCVKFYRFIKDAPEEEQARVLAEAEVHGSAGASLKRNELFEALGIETEENAAAPEKADPLAPIDSTDIFGSDDQPVGAMEMLSDDVMRIRLPDPTTMNADEREAAASAFIEQIRVYFGLDAAR